MIGDGVIMGGAVQSTPAPITVERLIEIIGAQVFAAKANMIKISEQFFGESHSQDPDIPKTPPDTSFGKLIYIMNKAQELNMDIASLKERLLNSRDTVASNDIVKG